MRFGMFDVIRWHESMSGEDTLANTLEQVEYADRLGIQDIWLGEHHFSRHGILSGIFSYMGAVAARTKQARIGTSIVILPFHNPVQVAEEAATIDIISGGRFNLGVGAGYQAQEFHGMGVDIAESRVMFKEYLDVVQQCWEEGSLTYSGQYVNIEDIWVIPEAHSEARSAHLHSGQHQPRERGLRREPGHPHPGRRSHHDARPDPARREDVARAHGTLRTSPRAY